MKQSKESIQDPHSPIVVQKRTRILDAYGNFGEHEPLIPGEDPPSSSLEESWRTTLTSIPRNNNNVNSHHHGNVNPQHETIISTGIRYNKNGVPEYTVRSFFRRMNFAFPSRWDVVEVTSTGAEAMLSYRHIGETLRDLPPTGPGLRRLQFTRPLRRRFFLLLTEPDTSVASAVFFFVLIISIFVLNIVMMMQTMTQFQFTPDDCLSCGGKVSYMFDDETFPDEQFQGNDYDCVCPPTPLPWTEHILKSLTYFFSVEWILRVVTFCPIPINSEGKRKGTWEYCNDWYQYITSWSMVLDFLAIFPYYMELAFQTNGLMSLRLLRLFRVMQLVRLGQYNNTFMSLTAVLSESLIYLKLLVGVLLFAAAFFGSMIYWLEKGDWKYWEPTQSYQFIRLNPQGIEEISPYKSIPDTFWWFFVTATTVGYGDSVPTSTAGKWVGFFAMMTGVLVIAFPVSVFSDLWSRELKKSGAIDVLDVVDDDDDDDIDDNDANVEREIENGNFAAAAQKLVAELDNPPTPLKTGTTASIPDDVTESVASVPGDMPSMKRRQTSSSLKPNQIAIDREDLIHLLSCVQAVQESQREIKSILRKYKFQLQQISSHTD